MCTLVKELPSLTSGTEGNSRFSLIVRDPALRLYRLDITSRRSDVVLTGKKRLRGTFIPKEFSKLLIAAPTAVSSWITFRPPSKVWKRKCSRSWDMLASWVLQIQFNSSELRNIRFDKPEIKMSPKNCYSSHRGFNQCIHKGFFFSHHVFGK